MKLKLKFIYEINIKFKIKIKDGIVLAAEKKIVSPLLDYTLVEKVTNISSTEKLYRIDSHMIGAVAGLTSDANILINYTRLTGQRHLYRYDTQMPVEQLVKKTCNVMQGYTQYGGLRPFGVSFLFAGYDKYHGFQLYLADPSGNYSGWKGVAIGSNYNTATTMLRQEIHADDDDDENDLDSKKISKDDKNHNKKILLDDALKLCVKILSKTIDSTLLNSTKLEFATVSKDEDNEVVAKIWKPKEVDDLLEKHKDLLNTDN
ncbi:proteasome subunit alpha type-4 [Anaeramoeba ignava]|uniref:Proteasome subunit alpha type-4 n=1 Tax=Anaeramoeba ignava TaxID=1746090 RepID=A0A9Q0LB77_ANAIG|nr:proteasome subunit alpha type-4 [Anaeramoeba ignava]